MTAPPLIDIHAHLYPDQRSGLRAKANYKIWEYGTDPGVEFDTAPGVLADVELRYAAEGFDHVVVLQLFDVATARSDAVGRLEPGRTPDEQSDALAEIEEALRVGLMSANRWIVDAAASSPMLSAYVCIDPCLLAPGVIATHLEEMASRGAAGVKLHPVSQGYTPGDPRLGPLYDACCALDLVVLSHSGPGHRAGASARPGEFAPVLERWPKLRLVLAHLGGAAFEEAAGVATAYPQVVFDLSEIIEWAGAPNAPSQKRLAEIIREIGAERVMLGSDFPWYEPARTAEKVASLPGLGADERAALLGETALGLLRLERARP